MVDTFVLCIGIVRLWSYMKAELYVTYYVYENLIILITELDRSKEH